MARKKNIFVTVGKMGGDAKQIPLTGAQTVGEALIAMGISRKSNETVQLNGSELTGNVLEHKLKDGDQVILTRQIEGGEK